MGRYINWSDVADRYPKLGDLGGSAEVNSHFLVYAENYIDSRLASCFTVPFSSNNLTVKDLAIDVTYLKTGYFKNKEAEQLKTDIEARLDMLCAGTMVMITTSGESLGGPNNSPMWSSTENYHPTHAMLDAEERTIDDDLLDEEANERDER